MSTDKFSENNLFYPLRQVVYLYEALFLRHPIKPGQKSAIILK